MNKIFARLMFPEPDDTGSGDTATETTADMVESTDTNPFDSIDFDKVDEQTEQADTDAEADTDSEEEEFTLTFEDGLDLDDSEKGFFTEAAKEAGLSAEMASKMFSRLVRKVNENNERIAKETETKALTELRKAWGKNFEANARQAAQLIKSVGARRGWTAEQMNALKNPHDMAMFYDIAAATGGRLSLGINKAVAEKAPLTKEQIASEMNNTIAEYWNAKAIGDTIKMNQLSDKHMELLAAQTGKKGVRLLAKV
jgi:hypothetical protein